MAGQQKSAFDIAIIGCGPVGATLANLMGLCGVRTLVLEREAAAYHLPRAVHFDDEAMRLFQTIGLSDAILPLVRLSPGMRFVDAAGQLVLDWSRPLELTPMGWNLSYRFHQPELEKVLKDGIARWPSVEVRNRCDVFAIDQADDHVTVRFEDLASGRLTSERVRYAVGCDGARSLVRRLIGAEHINLGFHERWLVIDVMLKRERPDLGDHSIQYCDPAAPATYVRGTGQRRRWEIALPDDVDPQAATQPQAVWARLARWIDRSDADIERAAVYTFHSTIAARWRNARLLLAGDSAHQTPPFLGQGLCAGLRDAANLAWKLAAVLDGRADDSLLDTYQRERMPHVREFIELAIRLGGLINTKAMDAGLAAGQRDGDAPAKLEVRKPLLGEGLGGADLRLNGRLVPQFKTMAGERSDDRIGYRFCLLLDADQAPPDSARLAAAGIEMRTTDQLEGLHDWLAENGIRAVLMRPDRYVFGTATSSAEVALLMEAAITLSKLPLAA